MMLHIKTFIQKTIVKLRNSTVRLRGTATIRSRFEDSDAIGEKSRYDGTSGYCSYIGNNIQIVTANQPLESFATIHPAFFSAQNTIRDQFVDRQKMYEHCFVGEANYGVSIGSNVRIGNSLLIQGGVTIGDGAVVAAGAIVTKDEPKYSIAGGAPGKVTRMRYSREQRRKLASNAWWEKDRNRFIQNGYLFEDADRLIRGLGMAETQNAR